MRRKLTGSSEKAVCFATVRRPFSMAKPDSLFFWRFMKPGRVAKRDSARRGFFSASISSAAQKMRVRSPTSFAVRK